MAAGLQAVFGLVLVPDYLVLCLAKPGESRSELLNKRKMTCPLRFRADYWYYDAPYNAKRSHSPSFSEGLPAKKREKEKEN